MIVLDVDDELGESLELETAAPEPAGIGEERSGGDARHVRGAGAFTGRIDGEGGTGAVNEAEAESSGSGWERRRARSGGADTGRPDRTAADAAGRQAGRWGGDGGRAGGLVAAYVTTCLPVGIWISAPGAETSQMTSDVLQFSLSTFA